MATVDCPLCDAAASYDEDAAVLDCPVCAIRLELAADEPLVLAAAA
jgi:primosomal protein N'